MTTAAALPDGGVLAEYRNRLSTGPFAPVDELAGPDGIRSHQESVAAAIEGLGLRGLRAAQAEARRFVRDDGIWFGSNGSGRPRRWEVDPLPVVLPAQEWADLEADLAQRATLLDLVLEDLYGPQELLRAGVIPAEVVYGHPGFVAQAVGVPDPRQRHLVLTAADLGRDAEGGWRLIADRNETPAGAGYAMASRRITTRVMAGLHRTTELVRLRGFFHTMTLALQEISVTGDEVPRVVLLSPGADSETAFEQAFIATLCGFPVVESEDLVVRDGRVWLETSDRPELVDVVLRRVDAADADPLELRSDSRIGVAGLVEAVRHGQVTVANPMGAGLLDNPGLLPHLPAACRRLLHEDLRIRSAQTWWCGEPASRSHVLANLDQLVIKPIGSTHRGTSRFGWRLSPEDLDDLRRNIEAQPWAWCGQEPLPLSTAPVVAGAGLEPRRLVLRTFSATVAGLAHLMPGGLARVAPEVDNHHVSANAGAVAKDVWVLAAGAAEAGPLKLRLSDRPTALARRTSPSPRVAENLFRVGRQAERVESLARLLRMTADLVEDHASRPGTPGAATMAALLGTVAQLTGIPTPDPGRGGGQPVIDHLRELVTEATTRGTISYAAHRLVLAAQQVRDQLSGDVWIVLSRLERTLGEIPSDDVQLQPQLAHVLESMLAMAGIIVENMVRDAAWGFIDAGTRVERAEHTLGLLRQTVATTRSPVIDGQVAEAVLMAGESIITHRRRTVTGEGPASPVHSAITLLLLDEGNPRSVAFQLRRLAEDLRLVGDPRLSDRVAGLLGRLGELDVEALCAGDRSALAATVDGLLGDVDLLEAAISRSHFSRRAPQHPLRPQQALSTREV